MAKRKMVSLPEMLGDELCNWIIGEQDAGRLTLPALRAKLNDNAAELEARGVVADYAYYAVQYVLGQLGQTIREE